MGPIQLYYISQTAPTPIGQVHYWSGAKNDENNDDQSQDDEDDCMLRDVDSSAFIFTRRGQFQDFRQAVVRLGPSGIQFTIPCKRNYGSARIFAKFHKETECGAKGAGILPERLEAQTIYMNSHSFSQMCSFIPRIQCPCPLAEK